METDRNPERRIALVGMPASGKSTVGRHLARRMGVPFVDLDDIIEAEAGATCGEIFAGEGEPSFRTRESRALGQVAAGGSVVMATGGGCILAEANRKVLRDKFTVVWLVTEPETAARRSAGGSRPLLAGADPLTRMKQLHAARKDLYAECADISFPTDRVSIEQIVGAIVDALA
jgi:shikimate kinase